MAMRLANSFLEWVSWVPWPHLLLIQVYPDNKYLVQFNHKYIFAAYRTLYSDTLETFPSAYMLLTASLMLVAAYSNFYLYTQRHRLKAKSDPVPEEDKTKVDEYVGYSQGKSNLELMIEQGI